MLEMLWSIARGEVGVHGSKIPTSTDRVRALEMIGAHLGMWGVDPGAERRRMSEPTRWMLGFFVHGGEWADGRSEVGFPPYEFWHADQQACADAGEQVLRARGDTRNWIAHGHPDPFEVGAGRHPGGQWLLSMKDLRTGGS